jgi:Mg-chelatase subunit ChlD
MTLTDRIKKTIPWADNPEPEANLTAADFKGQESERSDQEEGEDGNRGGAKNNQELSGSHEDGNSDSPTVPSPNNDGEQVDSDSSPDSNTDSSDGTDTVTDKFDDGADQQSGDGSADSDGEDDESESGRGQQSLFNYEDDDSFNKDVDDDESDQNNSEGDSTCSDEDGNEGDVDEDSNEDGETPGDGMGEAPGSSDVDSDGSESKNSDGVEQNEQGKQNQEIEPDNNSPTPPGQGEEPYGPHPDLIESEKERTDQERREMEQNHRQAEQELEKFAEALNNAAGGGDLSEVQFNISPSSNQHSHRWTRAVDSKENILALLEKILEHSRRDSWKRGKMKGQLDGKRLHQVPSKRLDVMKQRNPGNKKKYSVIVVLDRSGSMKGEKIKIAEEAIAQYALALENLDIEVCIMDMYNDSARVISPFGVKLENSKDDLMSKQTAGRTPLSDAIALARERMATASSYPVMISVTDGRPNDPERYQQELNKTHMDVMGITIQPGGRYNDTGTETEAQDQYYDVHTYVNSQSELEKQLEKMTLQIPF